MKKMYISYTYYLEAIIVTASVISALLTVIVPDTLILPVAVTAYGYVPGLRLNSTLPFASVLSFDPLQ